MAIFTCTKCSRSFTVRRDYEKHLARRYPCDAGDFKCEKCTQTFTKRSSRDHHRKHTCKGLNNVVAPQLQEAKKRIEELESQLSRISAKIAEDEEEHEEDEVDEGDESEEPSWVKPVDFEPATVFCCDAEEPQLYFFQVTGDLLKPLVKTFGIPVKTGSSETPYSRTMTHARDFGGGKLIDSIKTSNPKVVETKFKRWMRATARFVECKTPRKPGVEQEVFAAQNQEGYAMIVKKAKELADEYENTLQAQDDLVNQLKTVLSALKRE